MGKTASADGGQLKAGKQRGNSGNSCIRELRRGLQIHIEPVTKNGGGGLVEGWYRS
jgi:hypothetical protein